MTINATKTRSGFQKTVFEVLPSIYSYFPGCSLHSTGLEYGLSTRAVFQHLALTLIELPNWNCCGASSAHSLNHLLGIALPARNIAIAQENFRDLVTPCAACYSRMKQADYFLQTDPDLKAEIEEIVGFEYTGQIVIRPGIAVLHEDCGLEKIRKMVRIPLSGLRVVPYYGCLLLRPPAISQFDDPDNPRLVAHVGQLPGDRGQQEEGQDEQERGNRAEFALGLFRAVNAVDHEQHHRVLEQVVVECVEQLGHEQRQEAPAVDQVGLSGHALAVGNPGLGRTLAAHD